MRNRKFSLMGKVSLFFVLMILFISIFAPFFISHDPNEIHLDSAFAPISFNNLLGGDFLGRDILARLIYGARTSLFSIFIALFFIVFLGVLIGGACGFLGGVFDRVVMRICDIFFSIPTTILALFFVGIFGTGLLNILIAIILTHWAWYARITRSIAFSFKNKEFVMLSNTFGATRFNNFKRNFLPPILSQCLVLATMDIGHMMLHIAALSFLGLGVLPPNSEWGVMISEAKDFLWSYPSLVLYPGIALFIVVASFNMLGEALRDYFDVNGANNEN